MCLTLHFHSSFLNSKDCKLLIRKYGSAVLLKSKTTSPGVLYSKSRTSSQNKVIKGSDLIALKNKLSKKLNWDYQAIEEPHFIRYQAGDEYKLHHDDFPPIMFYMRSIYETNQIERYGNRIATAILYLNDNFDGGETEFPLISSRIKPETGLLVYWNNINQDGVRIEKALHSGLEVLSGTKYIIGFHLREKY